MLSHGVSDEPASWNTICGPPSPASVDRPRRRLLQSRDDPQQRRLAGAALPDDRQRLAGRDLEVDAVDGGDLVPAAAAAHAERLASASRIDTAGSAVLASDSPANRSSRGIVSVSRDASSDRV